MLALADDVKCHFCGFLSSDVLNSSYQECICDMTCTFLCLVFCIEHIIYSLLERALPFRIVFISVWSPKTNFVCICVSQFPVLLTDNRQILKIWFVD